MKQTLYEVLGVERDASTDDIVRAYEIAIARLTEGRMDDATRRVVLREAYQILSHPTRRNAYDARLAGPSAADIMSAASEYEKPDRSWVTWGVGVMIAISFFAGWKYKNKQAKKEIPPAPAPVQVQIEETIPSVNQVSVSSTPGFATSGSAEELYAQLSPSIARIDVSDERGNRISIGSGVAIGGSAMITNCHVVQNGSRFDVRMGDQSYSASVDVSDGEFDLCRLNVSGLSSRPMEIGSVSSLRVGEKVYAIGSPHGLELTISDGIVSSLRQMSQGTVIQTTTPVSPGSSGGGLFDAGGRLVGIVTFQARNGQNLNFAVPADWIEKMSTRPPVEGIGSMTMAESASESAIPSQQQSSPHDQVLAALLGTWQCFSTITGWNIQITFANNGNLILSKQGKSYGGRYTYSNQGITLYSAGKFSGTFDELSPHKLIVNAGQGDRLTCNR